jgi:transcriptional regulator with XRE-family HTH domain
MDEGMGQRAKAARQKKGWSQKRLAQESGELEKTIQRLESGKSIRDAALTRISELLDEDPIWILRGFRPRAADTSTAQAEPLGHADDIEIAIRRAGLTEKGAASFRLERRLGGSAYPLEVLIAIAKERRSEELGRSVGQTPIEQVDDEPDAPRFRG